MNSFHIKDNSRVQTQNKSPLRYPGGKTRAITVLESYVNKYYGNRKTLLSPFFGGGSFELYMKTKNYTIRANDLLYPLYTFWSVKQTDCDSLIQNIKEKLPITKDVFKNLQLLLTDSLYDEGQGPSIQKYERSSSLSRENSLEIAVSYYILNRTSFSGCGGFSKEASEKRLT